MEKNRPASPSPSETRQSGRGANRAQCRNHIPGSVISNGPLQLAAPRPKVRCQYYRDHKQGGPELTAYIPRPSVVYRQRLKELLHEGVVTGMQYDASPQAS